MRDRAWPLILACAFTGFGTLAACESSSGTGGAPGCTPGAETPCACSDGGEGTQICKDDGSGFDACQCQGSTSTGSTGPTSSSSGSPSTCGDGIMQPGECDPSSQVYCPSECMGSSSSSNSSSSSGGACAGHVYYAGKYDLAPPTWAILPGASGATGLAAGDAQCANLNIGADHVCDYEEVLKAEMQGELAGVPLGTTAWVQRTTVASVGGQPSQPGPGGRCNDWTDQGNELSDGEYITFAAQGTPTYHLDGDTIYDPATPGAHTSNDFPCGGMMRAILCCFPSCD